MIYHISTEDLFHAALEKNAYEHPSLKTEGFIHCSTKQQLPDTLAKHFPDAQEVFLLHIVENRIRNLIKWEEAPSRPQAGPFPHIYGKLPLEAIEDVSIQERLADGSWDFSRLPGKGVEVSPPDEEWEI
jgi:uncharacterized protein (DUF952 family)